MATITDIAANQPDVIHGNNEIQELVSGAGYFSSANTHDIRWPYTDIDDAETVTVPDGTVAAFFKPDSADDDVNVTLSGTTLTFNVGTGTAHSGTVLLKVAY